MDERLACLALSLLPEMDGRTLRRLRSHCASARAAWEHLKDLPLPLVGGEKPAARRGAWLRARAGMRPQEELERLASRGIRFIIREDPEYPAALARIFDPPEALFLKGEKLPGERLIAVVGARKASAHGRHLAEEMAEGLAQRGIGVVSGAAYGIDAAAHRGAPQGGRPHFRRAGARARPRLPGRSPGSLPGDQRPGLPADRVCSRDNPGGLAFPRTQPHHLGHERGSGGGGGGGSARAPSSPPITPWRKEGRSSRCRAASPTPHPGAAPAHPAGGQAGHLRRGCPGGTELGPPTRAGWQGKPGLAPPRPERAGTGAAGTTRGGTLPARGSSRSLHWAGGEFYLALAGLLMKGSLREEAGCRYVRT